MNKFTNQLLAGALFATLGLAAASGQGFTEPNVLFYGEVRKSGGGQTVLLQSGSLEMTFVNQSNAANLPWPPNQGSRLTQQPGALRPR